MQQFKSDFLSTLAERGFIYEVTKASKLDDIVHMAESSGNGIGAYIGFDCTASNLHTGSLIQLMMLKWLKKCGHNPFVIVGQSTAQIGDPSGKSKERVHKSRAEIDANAKPVRELIAGILDSPESEIKNNADWLERIDLFREVGCHMSMHSMLGKRSIRDRLDTENFFSFQEFSYMLFQAFDFVHLHREHDVILQMGGSDQWGNITAGNDLNQRMVNAGSTLASDGELFGLTSVLLTDASGNKIGKTSDGDRTWLSHVNTVDESKKTSQFDFWQHWRNVSDADVGRFLRLFTMVDLNEVERLERLKGQEINEAKVVLANHVTDIVHGDGVGELMQDHADKVFSQGQLTNELKCIAIEPNEGILNILTKSNICNSNSDARRTIQSGAIRLNDEKVSDWRKVISLSDFIDGKVKLSKGRKQHVVLEMAA